MTLAVKVALNPNTTNQIGQDIYNHKILDEFDYGSNRIRMTRVICLFIRKIAAFDSVYTLASTIINQWAPNVVKLYMTIRSCLSLIMAVIGLERLQLFALELEKLLYLTCLHSSIYNY